MKVWFQDEVQAWAEDDLKDDLLVKNDLKEFSWFRCALHWDMGCMMSTVARSSVG